MLDILNAWKLQFQLQGMCSNFIVITAENHGSYITPSPGIAGPNVRSEPGFYC